MTTRPADAQQPAPKPSALEPGLRAARKRLRLSQERAAQRAGVPLSTFRRWDRTGKPPGNIAMAQAVAEALETPLEVLWPPEDNPIVSAHLATLREERARAAEEAALADPTPDETLWDPAPATRSVPAPPVVATPGIPPVEEILALVDGPNPHRRRSTTRMLVPLAVVVGVVIATVAIVAGDHDPSTTSPSRTTPAASSPVVAPTAVGGRAAEDQRERAVLTAALQRRDYRRAIQLAESLKDSAAESNARRAGARIVLRRASNALDDRRFSDARRHLRAATRTYENPYPNRARALYERLHELETRAARARQRRAETARRTPSSPTPAASRSQAAPAPAPMPGTSTPSSGSGSSGSSSSGGGSGSAQREFDYLGN